MQAIQVYEFGPPEVMGIETIPDIQPGPGQVCVRIKAAGVNPVDAYIRAGLYRPDMSLPYTPGLDGAGIVEALGSGVEKIQIGQRVYFTWAQSGSYAEKVVCDATNIYPLPQNITYAQGAALGVPYGTAYRALFQCTHTRPGETLLIHGASGGVGLASVQFAQAAGIRVIGTAGSKEGMSLVRQQGACFVVNHNEPGYETKIKAFAGENGVNVILEMLANVNLGNDLALLGKEGRIIVIGCRGKVELDPRETMSRDASIQGMTLFNASPQDLAGIHAAIAAGMEKGFVYPVVSREIPLAQAAVAHHAIMETSSLGKIVLEP